MTQAERNLARAQAAIARGAYTTIGKAINGCSPKYSFIEKMDDTYRLYHFIDQSYIMTYIDARKQQAWSGPKA